MNNETKTNQLTITVYPNRHMRASDQDFNDLKGGHYISLKAVRALKLAGFNLTFIQRVITHQDITVEMNAKLTFYKWTKNQERAANERREKRREFDPFDKSSRA